MRRCRGEGKGRPFNRDDSRGGDSVLRRRLRDDDLKNGF